MHSEDLGDLKYIENPELKLRIVHNIYLVDQTLVKSGWEEQTEPMEPPTADEYQSPTNAKRLNLRTSDRNLTPH